MKEESPEYQREEQSKQRKHTSASLRAGGSLVCVKKTLQKVERKEVRRRDGETGGEMERREVRSERGWGG